VLKPSGRLIVSVNHPFRENLWHREIGLEPDDVRVVGWLHPLFTLTSSSLVLPIVGVLGHRPTVVPNPAEVARVFDVELASP